MSRLTVWCSIAISTVATLWILQSSPEQANAQSGLRSTVQQAPFHSRFWSWLTTAQYQQWAPLSGQGIDAYPGESPHGAFLKVYANRTAHGNAESFPNGSVIIKENYGKDQKTLMAITVMFKATKYNPQGGDWYWIKYNPDGSVARNRGMMLVGKVQGCIDCHAGAEGDDFVFLND
jgi:hypothetical protein